MVRFKSVLYVSGTNVYLIEMDSVVHFEIPADDVERAKKFYRQIFGWEITSVPEMNYNIVNTTPTENNMPKSPGAINGGLMKRQGENAPVIVINVSSVDDYLKKIESVGGKVVLPKMQVGDMGLYARVMDTEGNVIGIWQTIKQ